MFSPLQLWTNFFSELTPTWPSFTLWIVDGMRTQSAAIITGKSVILMRPAYHKWSNIDRSNALNDKNVDKHVFWTNFWTKMCNPVGSMCSDWYALLALLMFPLICCFCYICRRKPLPKAIPQQLPPRIEYIVERSPYVPAAAPVPRPALCPVYIPADYVTLPTQGIQNTEIMPSSELPIGFQSMGGAHGHLSYPQQEVSISTFPQEAHMLPAVRYGAAAPSFGGVGLTTGLSAPPMGSNVVSDVAVGGWRPA